MMSGIFRTIIVKPTGRLKKCVIIVATPVMPPTVIPAGSMNIFIAAANSSDADATAAIS